MDASEKDMMISVEYCMKECVDIKNSLFGREKDWCYKNCIDYEYYLKSMSSGYHPVFALLSPYVSRYGDVPKYWT